MSPRPRGITRTPEHNALALEAARRSLVLLKNDGLLPLNREALHKVAVIGPNADSRASLNGNYHGTPSRSVTVLEGLRQELVGELALDSVAREISARGEALSLTPREFAILEQLMLCQGRWLSQEELMEHVWAADANPFSNAVRMHISSLRKKLRERLGFDPIQTKVGQGYRLAGEEAL